MEIREACPDDVPRILDLIRQLGETDQPGQNASPGHVLSTLAHPAVLILVAETGGVVVGLLSCTVRPNLYHGSDAAHVDELVVDRDHRGRGIGSLLLQEFLRRMQAQRCAEVSVGVLQDNLGAQSLYRKLGFIEEVLLLERHFH
jgi:ribosomal protein S18 acetylase RimI-like enzyme